MADLYLTPAERYTAALGGFYYGDLPEPGTVYTQLIKDILNGTTPDKEPKNILARFIYSLYISDLGDPYPRYELAKLLYWKLHDITPTKSGSILTVTIDGKEDYMTINTDLSRLWYKVCFGSKTDVITDFPYIFNTMQTKLSDWELFGNTEVSRTPTPDNPVIPEGTGERTGNLADTIMGGISTTDGSDTVYNSTQSQVRSQYILCIPNTRYTVSANKYPVQSFIAFYNDNKEYISRTSGMPLTQERIVEVPDNAVYMRATFVHATDEQLYPYSDGVRIMLNLGSTAIPYEPYGYKIPISSAGQTTTVYLGEVETTRRIKKLVLTGEESGWQKNTVPENNAYYRTISGYYRYNGLCSHYATVDSARAETGIFFGGNINFLTKLSDEIDTVDKWKSYLAAQYAAGTPVTVWYVLAAEETAVVNEPLMKIGEYADSMSRTQTGIDIPTVIGQNTLDVLTTVKPSSMRIEYTSADETKSRSKRISLLKSPLKKGLIK